MDSRYSLEVNSGLSDGLDEGMYVREVSRIIQGSACAAAWINVFYRDEED